MLASREEEQKSVNRREIVFEYWSNVARGKECERLNLQSVIILIKRKQEKLKANANQQLSVRCRFFALQGHSVFNPFILPARGRIEETLFWWWCWWGWLSNLLKFLFSIQTFVRCNCSHPMRAPLLFVEVAPRGLWVTFEMSLDWHCVLSWWVRRVFCAVLLSSWMPPQVKNCAHDSRCPCSVCLQYILRSI